MKITLTLFQLIFLLGAIHGLVHSVIIFFGKRISNTRLLFALFILSIALACLKTVLQEALPLYYAYLPIPLLFQFSWGPLLLLYTRSTLYKGFRPRRSHLLLFIPSLLFDILFPLLAQWAPADPELQSDLSLLIDFAAAFHFTYFIGRSIRALRAFKKGLEGFYSNISSGTITWLVALFTICGVLLVCWLFYIVATLWLWSYDLPVAGMKTYYPVYIWFSCSIYYLVYHRYRHPSIQQVHEPAKTEKPDKKPVYDPQSILVEVRTKAYYQDPKLTLKKLAALMELNINDLSQTVNAGLHKTFNDFINELRVEEVKRRMHDPAFRHLSQLGIALESGFNSKATFQRAFKKFTGMTPGAYQKSEKTGKKKSQMPI